MHELAGETIALGYPDVVDYSTNRARFEKKPDCSQHIVLLLLLYILPCLSQRQNEPQCNRVTKSKRREL